MNVLIIGCGKVGSKLARTLDRQGHDVFVIDQDERNFELLGNGFSGFTESGVPIDQDVLKKAGIENCDAVAAVTQKDNINIMTSQLAREIFHVPIVITRIYDPSRKDVFSHFGLHTICPTNLTVDAVCEALTRADQVRNLTFGTSTVSFVSREVLPEQIGHTPATIGQRGAFENELFFAVLAEDGTIYQRDHETYRIGQGDMLVFSKVVD